MNQNYILEEQLQIVAQYYAHLLNISAAKQKLRDEHYDKMLLFYKTHNDEEASPPFRKKPRLAENKE